MQDSQHLTPFDALLRAAAATPRLPGRTWRAGTTLYSGRFRVLRRLGRGSTGVVYETLDTLTGARIALKTLARVDAQSVYRLKREFRALIDVAHPNIVTPHALFEDDADWFIAMELVRGLPFTRAVRLRDRLDLNRLRTAMGGLAHGLQALHAVGLVHRDIKPSNVLVSGARQAKILDFGLIAGGPSDGARGEVWSPSGTPAYMAPEQAAGAPASAACDWYAVGVMLYEALTGRLPHAGSVPQLMAAKQRESVRAPSALDAGVPSALDSLCLSLLEREPSARAGGDAIRAAFEGNRRSRRAASAHVEPFVGREAELEALRAALTRTRAGRPVLVQLHGPSGIGKSALVRRFLAEHADGAVFTSRCHESESVPFKALDGIVDALSWHMSRAGHPCAAPALSRLFPVMERASHAPASTLPRDTRELRQCAVAELSAMLRRIAADRAAVVHIDDLQWGDIDSLDVVAQLLRAPEPAAMLVVLSYRSTDVAQSPCLRELIALQLPDCEREEITLSGLDARDVQQLCAGSALPAPLRDECEGNPFLLLEALQHLRGVRAAANAVSLAQVLQARIGGVSAAGAELLEAMAVAARPLTLDVAAHATGLRAQLQREAANLRVHRLIRLTPRGLEMYHDRIRENIRAKLSADRERAWHERLALAYEANAPSQVESIAEHLLRCGQSARAMAYAEQAAERAEHALAFDRAAALQRLILEREPRDARDRVRRLRKIGELLADAGRGADAAAAYVEAAAIAEEHEAAMLRALAGGHWVLCGDPRAGGELLHAIRDLGLTLPDSTEALFEYTSSLAAKLRERMQSFVLPASHAQPDRRACTRVDACYAIAIGLLAVDGMTAMGHTMRLRALWEALDLAEPRRVARAAYQLTLAAADVENHPQYAGWIVPWLELAERAAQSVDEPELRAWSRLVAGSRAFIAGRLRDGLPDLLEAEQIFREQCRGVMRELAIARFEISFGLMVQNRLPEQLACLRAWQQDARQRGDRYLEARLEVMNPEWLMADDPGRARAEVERCVGDRPEHDAIGGWVAAIRIAKIDLYAGAAWAAWRRTDPVLRQLRAAPTVIVTRMLTRWSYEHALCAVAVMESADVARADRAELDAALNTAIECLEYLPATNCRPQLGLLLAARRFHGGDREGAGAHLRGMLTDRVCDGGFEMYAPIVRWGLGQLVGGDEGRALLDGVERELRALGVQNPLAWVRMHGPMFRTGHHDCHR